MVKAKLLAVLCPLLLGFAVLAHAENSVPRVRLGPVYGISEPDMVQELQDKLQKMQADGSLRRMQEEAAANGARSIARPAGVGLPRAAHSRQWTHDPSYVVPSDIADHQGRKFAYAGDRINPLERGVSLRQPLLFLDTDDPVQAKALPALISQFRTPKVILINGDWQAASRQIGYPVYFDQRGSLVKTFGISAVPAVVEQKGTLMQVTEIVVREDQP